jgi:hypothetical protein
MPSATTFLPFVWTVSITDFVKRIESSFSVKFSIGFLSILRISKGISLKIEIELCPDPKSSMEKLNPFSFSFFIMFFALIMSE